MRAAMLLSDFARDQTLLAPAKYSERPPNLTCQPIHSCAAFAAAAIHTFSSIKPRRIQHTQMLRHIVLLPDANM